MRYNFGMAEPLDSIIAALQRPVTQPADIRGLISPGEANMLRRAGYSDADIDRRYIVAKPISWTEPLPVAIDRANRNAKRGIPG